jgi:hypothetical protein
MPRGKRTKTFTARFEGSLVERLERRSDQMGQSNSRLAERLIDEGLPMEEFPGIIFRPGPTGRRAALATGPDVWELIRDLKRARGEGVEDPVGVVSEGDQVDRQQVELALAYYTTYPEDIDERLRLYEEMAARVRAELEGTHVG